MQLRREVKSIFDDDEVCINQPKIIFQLMPNKLVNLILEMLSPREVPVLRAVNRWFKDFIDSNDPLVANQVFSLFFTKQVDCFCEYGENDLFLQERSKKNYSLAYSVKSQLKWRTFLKSYETIREATLMCLVKMFKLDKEDEDEDEHASEQELPQLLQLGTNQAQEYGVKLSEKKRLIEESVNERERDCFQLSTSISKATEGPFKFVFEECKCENEAVDEISNELISETNFFGSLGFKGGYSSEDDTSQKVTCAFRISQKKVSGVERNAANLSKLLWSIMRDPPLPSLKLRRENVGNFCKTWFQNRLVEDLWEGSKQTGFFSNLIIDENRPLAMLSQVVKLNQGQLVQEIVEACKNNSNIKNEFLNLRYYFYQTKDTHDSGFPRFNSRQSRRISNEYGNFEPLFQKAVVLEERSNQTIQEKPLLLEFFDRLVEIIKFRCQVIFEYLRGHLSSMNESIGFKKNGFDLLSEYCICWNSYVGSLNELEEQLRDVVEALNLAFSSVFDSHPAHPLMSVWRLMAKLWVREVYQREEMKENLYGCFLKVLSIRRQGNFLYQMRQQITLDSKVQQQSYMPTQIEHISLVLQNNLNKNRNFSLLDYGEGYEYHDNFFSKNQFFEDALLGAFVEAILDISLNEISVHFLGHSRLQTDSPYEELEKQLLESSRVYFNHQQNMFFSNPSQFLLFLQADLKYLTNIFKERSCVKMKDLMVEQWTSLFSSIITTKIPQTLASFENKDEKTKSFYKQQSKVMASSTATNEQASSQETLQSPFQSTDFFLQLLFDILDQQAVKMKKQDWLDSQLSSSSKDPLKLDDSSSQSQSLERCLNDEEKSLDELIPLPQSIFKQFSSSSVAEISITQEECKDIREKCFLLQQLMLTDEQIRYDVQNFNELCKETTAQQFSDQDLEIDELNSTRRLPRKLNQEEQVFYFITQQVTETILTTMICNQQEFLQSQRRAAEDEVSDQSRSYSEGEREIEGQEQEFNERSGQQQVQGGQKGKRQLEIPVYNSDEESAEELSENSTNELNLFANVIVPLQSEASGFSLGLTKEESRISNFNLFPDIPISTVPSAHFNFFDDQVQQGQQQPCFPFDFFSGHSAQQETMGTDNNQVTLSQNISSKDVETSEEPENDYFSNIRSKGNPSSERSQSNSSSNANASLQPTQTNLFPEFLSSSNDENSKRKNLPNLLICRSKQSN